jgi:two-component system, LytTR family, sensor kinase
MLPSTLPRTETPVPLPEVSLPTTTTPPTDRSVPPDQLSSAVSESSRPRFLGLLVFIVWTLISLCQAAQYYFFHDSNDGPPLSWIYALGLGFGLWYSWGLLGLLAFRLSRTSPLGTHHWPIRLTLHVAASLVFATVKLVIDYPIILYLYCRRPDIFTLPYYLNLAFGGPFLRFILYYWAIISVSHALSYYGKYREGQLRAAQLEAGLTRARLQLLKTQLQPHFLFNTLNAISALLHVDVEAADRMLARLGDLLRLALEDFGVQEAPLARELEAARSYLEIEQARLGPRLQVEWDIAADLGDTLVPTFLLQPLLENAVHHGIAPRIEAGRIDIRIRREGTQLHLEVRDDGPGLTAGGTSSGGVGLANTRSRLLHLYGTAQRLEVRNGRHGGCVAHVILPFRELATESADNTRENHDPHTPR